MFPAASHHRGEPSFPGLAVLPRHPGGPGRRSSSCSPGHTRRPRALPGGPLGRRRPQGQAESRAAARRDWAGLRSGFPSSPAGAGDSPCPLRTHFIFTRFYSTGSGKHRVVPARHRPRQKHKLQAVLHSAPPPPPPHPPAADPG